MAKVTGSNPVEPTRLPVRNLTGQPDVDFAFDVVPFSRSAQPCYELLERGRVGGRVLEPCQEVKGLPKVATMVETSGDCGEVLEADRDVVRVLFENRPSFVLGQLPPFPGLGERDESGSCRFRPVKGRLHRGQPVVLGLGRVPLVASHSAEYPNRVLRNRFGGEADLEVTGRRQRRSAYAFESLDFPSSGRACHEGCLYHPGGFWSPV